MTELNEEKNITRPASERAFLSCTSKTFCRMFVLRTTLPALNAHLIFWPLMAAGIAMDLWSKKAVFDWLRTEGYSSVSIIDGFLQIVAVENAGAAFGIATGRYYLLTIISGLALIVILAVFLLGQIRQKTVLIALGLFAAGVCGNFYDRIFNNGLVRDFIDVVYWPGRHWPAFNVADSMLCTAVAILFFSSLFTAKSSQKHVRQHK